MRIRPRMMLPAAVAAGALLLGACGSDSEGADDTSGDSGDASSVEFKVTETFPTGEQYGFAVTKENTALLTALDAALATAITDGSYEAAYTEWFGDDTAPTITAAPGAADADLSLDGVTLVSDGTLTVCSDMPYQPFEFEEDGETTGFDYDVVSAMGDLLGAEVEFVTTPFDSIIPALVAGNCDMIASAMTITPERAEQVSFTAPYFDADQSLLVLAENAEEFATLEDLADKTIGVQVETTGASYAKENLPEGATIKEFQTGDEMFPALIAGEIDAALQDLPVNAYRAATSTGSN
ncbi:MAG: transporter substrate-binding domain-containing protein [Microthrixaceae bacterium]